MLSKSSLAIVSVLTTTVLAQSYPSGISDSCLAYYKAFDEDSTLKSCTTAFASATSTTNGTTPTKDSITSTLTSICSPSSAANQCSDALIRTQLNSFTSACSAELTANNKEVVAFYDNIYLFSPLKTSLCAKDDGGNFCALSASQNVAANQTLLEQIQKATNPDLSVYTAAQAPFLFLTPELPDTTLCKACTRNVITAYTKFASDSPYANGADQSQLLTNMKALYDGVVKTCGPNFLSSTVQAAGGLGTGSGSGSNAGFKMAGVDLVAMVLGVVAVVVSM
ncbi:hypothetical protein V5O48_007923 [Marasmius crinis-equi]|uniref:DUF7729 domain-containing protein n=1 Tax=Marasmius crinis-equi TaxID=585013 RepID=A0ABR3FFI1_9AGAR